MTVDDLLKALLLESANDAAVTIADERLRLARRFVRDMNRARPLARPEGHALRQSDRARRPGQLLDRARPRDARAPPAREPALRPHRRPAAGDAAQRLATGASCATATASSLPSRAWTASRRATRARAGYVLVGSATGAGCTVVSVVLGEPTRRRATRDSLALLRFGIDQYRASASCGRARAVAAAAGGGHDGPRVRGRARADAHRHGAARPPVERGSICAARLRGPAGRGDGGRGAHRACDGKVVRRIPLVTARAVPEPQPCSSRLG